MILLAPDISFSIPQRKKMALGIYHYPSTNSYTLGGGTRSGTTPEQGEMEYEIPISSIDTALRLPVPEKVGRSWNYVFLGREMGVEGVVFTVNEPSGKKGEKRQEYVGEDLEMVKRYAGSVGGSENLLEAAMAMAGVTLTVPEEKEFASATPEAHRKGEKAFHVKAFRGSKDGFLFFLATGIFFGFKKPLFYVRLEDVESVSYTSVLQRTFNMVISYREGDEEKEVEFSMLDQADYGGINRYVGKHGLSDASLAAGRRAKIVGKKKTGENGTVAEEDDDGRTELEKVEAQLQDEEDEGEEDFELGSSDEGDDSGDDEDDSDGDFDEEGGNLVREELGSEAEDVSEDEEQEPDPHHEHDLSEREEDEDEDDPHHEHNFSEVEEEEEEEDAVKEVPRPVPVKAPVFQPRRPGEPDPEDGDQL